MESQGPKLGLTGLTSIVAGRESGSSVYIYNFTGTPTITQISTLDGITAWEKTKGVKSFSYTERYLTGILIAAASFSLLQGRGNPAMK